MNGLTIATIVFGALLVVVWLPVLVVSIRKAWKASAPSHPEFSAHSEQSEKSNKTK